MCVGELPRVTAERCKVLIAQLEKGKHGSRRAGYRRLLRAAALEVERYKLFANDTTDLWRRDAERFGNWVEELVPANTAVDDAEL